MTAQVVDDAQQTVSDGTPGELRLAGPQVTGGYFEDPERTAGAFVLDGGDTYYRTGDRVVRDPHTGTLAYLGRTDHQIKVRGFRVELGDVEAAVRDVLKIDTVVALGWPKNAAGADAITVFADADAIARGPTTRALRARLPGYMVPKKIIATRDFPLNANGKVDRGALMQRLEEGA